MDFFKLWGGRLLTSSLWLESAETRVVFMTLLGSADAIGFVEMADERVLAQRAALPVEAVKAALSILEAPDKSSRRKDNDGRRVVRVEDPAPGWFVTNLAVYRGARTEGQAITARRKKREREGKRPQGRGNRGKAKTQPSPMPVADLPDQFYDQLPDHKRAAASLDRTLGTDDMSWAAPGGRKAE